jgi:putative membrane protein
VIGHTTATPPPTPAATDAASFGQWRRVSGRVAIAGPAHHLAHIVPLLVLSVFVGSATWWYISATAAVLALILVKGVGRWFATHYRLTGQHLEVRTGLLHRDHLLIRRDRIRGVSLTHKLTYRVLGLAVVRIGTSDHKGVALDGVLAADAAHLQRLLLTHPADLRPTTQPATTPSTPPATQGPAPQGAVTLTTFTARWLLYAPFTPAGWAAVTGLAGAITKVADRLTDNTFDTAVLGWITAHSPWLTAALLAAAVPAIYVPGSIAVYLALYWDFRLTREHSDRGGMLRVNRGLLTTRAASVTEARLRGVEIVEWLPLRAVGGAAARALVAGRGAAGSRMTLTPPGPLREAQRVCAKALRTTRSPTAWPLRRHPHAALRRRLVRGVAPAVLLAVVLTVAAPPWAWWTAWALVPALAAVSWDRYRALGHALTTRYLVTRSGCLRRHTAAVQRTGIIGWRISQTWGQRRAGLVTVSATTAAAAGVYSVIDIDADTGLQLAATAVPGLLDDLLHHDDERHGRRR